MYSYVTRMYSYVTRMYSYVTRMYSYVIRMYSYVLVCYSYVLVWCYSHDEIYASSNMLGTWAVAASAAKDRTGGKEPTAQFSIWRTDK